MPIGTRFQVKEISDKEFKSLDYKIMGIVFDVHNEFGPLCSEKIYKTEIADRCLKQKLGVVQIEEPIYSITSQIFVFCAKEFLTQIN